MHQAMPLRGWLRARRSPAVPTPAVASRGQAGYTLIEVVIAVALTGLVILSLATAMLTIVRANGLNSDRQRVDAAMTSFSESVRGGAYLPCGETPAPTAAGYNGGYDPSAGDWAPPTGVDVNVVDVEYWDRNADEYVDTCPVDDGGAQRLTLTTSWRNLERSAQIVVRR